MYVALIKFDRFEWIVEKATELGVTEIVPVEASRCKHCFHDFSEVPKKKGNPMVALLAFILLLCVVGGGIVGLCLAGFLAEAGHGVVLVDDGRHSGTTANAGSLHVQMQSRFMRLLETALRHELATLSAAP